MKKRIISLLLAVMMLAGMMSVSAFADGDVVISLVSHEDSGEFYPGANFSVPVKIGPDGYAGVQIDVKTSANIEFTGYTGVGYVEYSQTGLLWLNGVEDEEGGVDVTSGLVNIKNSDLDLYDGAVVDLVFTIADDAAAGDAFEIELTVSAASAEEQWIVKEEIVSTSGTISKRPYILGDVDDTGEVDVFDALAVLEYSIDESYADNNTFIKEAADVDGVEGIDIFDAVAILEMAIG